MTEKESSTESVQEKESSTESVQEKESSTESAQEQKDKNGQNQEDEQTELDSKIIRQVEYYFGDANLPRDKFLREQVKLDEGWVPLDILTKFNRLAKLTTDTEVIGNAVNKSTSGLLEISDDGKKVRRSPEMPLPEMNEERRKDLQGRTVYVKGFPKDALLDDIIKFFKEHGEVENVIMRRYLEKTTKTRKFKGSVFTTFKDKEMADKFKESKGLKHGDTELLILWQVDYLQQKQEEYVARKDKKEKKQKDGEVKEEKEGLKLPTGTVLFFSEGHDKMTREDVKEALTPLGGEVAYIDFKVGDTQGWVRLTKQDAAKEVFSKITDAKLKIGDAEVHFKLLEGEEEKNYLEKTVEEMSKRRRNMKQNKHQNRGGKNYKGKQQFNRKRKHGNHEDAPASKVKAE